MKDDTKNLYLAIIVSMFVIFGVNYFFPITPVETSESSAEVTAEEPTAPIVRAEPLIEERQEETLSSSEDASADQSFVAEMPRIRIETPALTGSINPHGALFDDLSLNRYKKTLDADSPNVSLLSSVSGSAPYYAEFGWISDGQDKTLRLPSPKTLWTVRNSHLTPTTPVVLEYDNGEGLIFTRTIFVDENYLFTLVDTVMNRTNEPVSLRPYGRIGRTYDPSVTANRSVVHEGISSVIDGTLKEIRLKDLDGKRPEQFDSAEAWAGFSDRYWFTAFILNDDSKNRIVFSADPQRDQTYYATYSKQEITVAPGASVSDKVRFFAGAKEIKLLDSYADEGNIAKFDLAVDFGWYYFLTKPFFYILTFLYGLIGNMGWAILLFAALLRLAMFPIANKSYESMSKMRKIQPKVLELQKKYAENKMLLQQATMELYRREKINPASGCLPMFIQIPVFFSLYKVLNIALEIRHAPFFGWIQDLSAPDPLKISTWSHIPLPAFIDIGVWPILMGLTMWIQQKLNPAPANKDQARMFAMMPIIFTFMLGQFASGLVIYWTLSNLLSILQQKAIMRRNGVK